jgi:hypothetical protein
MFLDEYCWRTRVALNPEVELLRWVCKVVHASSLDNISQISRVFFNNNPAYNARPAGGLPQPTNIMRGGKARHCVFLPVLAILIFQGRYSRAKQEFSKNLVSYYVWLYFMLWYGSLEIPCVMQTFLLWCRSVRSLFHAYALFYRANIIGSCFTQPKIARIISIVSGVLWWWYATYAFPCIMTKASSGYHMRCAHFAHHILEGVWLLALLKADWDKVCPGRSRVCPWTVFSFIHLGCCLMACQWWDEV